MSSPIPKIPPTTPTTTPPPPPEGIATAEKTKRLTEGTPLYHPAEGTSGWPVRFGGVRW